MRLLIMSAGQRPRRHVEIIASPDFRKNRPLGSAFSRFSLCLFPRRRAITSLRLACVSW